MNMMDKYIHTRSVSGWPLDSRGAPIYALKQVMESKKSQLITPTSGGASWASAVVNSRRVAEDIGLLDTSAAENRLGRWWVWATLCTSGLWIGPGETTASLALAGHGLGAGLPCKVLPSSRPTLCSRPVLSLWEFYPFFSHHKYKIGLEYNCQGRLSSAVCSRGRSSSETYKQLYLFSVCCIGEIL